MYFLNRICLYATARDQVLLLMQEHTDSVLSAVRVPPLSRVLAVRWACPGQQVSFAQPHRLYKQVSMGSAHDTQPSPGVANVAITSKLLTLSVMTPARSIY